MSQHGDATASAPIESAHLLSDDSGKTMFGCAGIALPILAVLLFTAVVNDSIVFTIVLSLLVMLVLGAFIWAAIEVRKWGPLDVHFEQWPLELGSTTQARVIRRAKSAVPNASFDIESEVECSEWVRYTVGTDTRTDERTVYKDSTKSPGQLSANTFEALIHVHIPADAGAPTIELNDNRVKWELAIDVSELSTLSNKTKFNLVVGPVLARTQRNIQDSPPGAH